MDAFIQDESSFVDLNGPGYKNDSHNSHDGDSCSWNFEEEKNKAPCNDRSTIKKVPEVIDLTQAGIEGLKDDIAQLN